MTDRRKLLVTSALPYANGSIHIGHLVEYLQTDIWVRYMRACGHDCLYFCADDAHGAPIMLRAESEGVTAEQLVARIGEEHRADFADFGIEFSNYYSTHSEENRLLASDIYQRLEQAGHIKNYPVAQAYDGEKGMFLADRYIRGGCPRCGAEDQYGDNCEVCGATYGAMELIEPRSVLTGSVPETRESEHYFFHLEDFQGFLAEWTRRGHLDDQVSNKIQEWFEGGLRDWDISRDEPYFGFRIPGTDNKYFYVWLDAPVGYIASYWNWLKQHQGDVTLEQLREQWAEREIHHFIGKDILYFHALFWPAMLKGAGYRTPEKVNVHGFLMVNGEKMSKSRGTFIQARTYLDHLDPEYLRYYFAAKLSNGVDDLDLNLDDFVQKVNSDLVGKMVNIASRSAGYIYKKMGGELAPALENPQLYAEFVQAGEDIGKAYEAREYSKVCRQVMALADRANQYLAELAPWSLAKQEGTEQQVAAIYSQAINLFRVLATYLSPILPVLAANSQEFLGLKQLDWVDLQTPLLSHRINKFKPLMQRVEPEAVAKMVAETRD
ncbi:MAG: methionine--tRNA ligase [Gammaproteobacteria bacterium]|nr:MAG: methionine--tRNA ligase [Gammaproteobacteria bacterium]RLA10667.1 MAG: methionine--tRNA ligase [Gammaproteobacteria bacterium]RLA17919.1 MAG: methionine--tRNA ligase [Gammaproteobacteria bacterium]